MSKFKILNDGLVINKISKNYGNKYVIRDINIEIKRENVILGYGAGKTTTFILLLA